MHCGKESVGVTQSGRLRIATNCNNLGAVPSLWRAGDEDLADGVEGVPASQRVQAVLALNQAVVHAHC